MSSSFLNGFFFLFSVPYSVTNCSNFTGVQPHKCRARVESVLPKIRNPPPFKYSTFLPSFPFSLFSFPRSLRFGELPHAGGRRRKKENLMSRGIDSEYINFSHMGGFDMGINFDGFEENVKMFMELPIKYLDSAHDKAVEFIEDVHAIFWAPFPDDRVPNKEDQSSSNAITASSPTAVETGLVGPNAEASTPASLVTVENSSTDCVSDTHETESFSTKSAGLSFNHVYPENSSSEGHIKATDLCILPEDTSTLDSSEEVILWNPETFVRPVLTTISQDDHAPHALEIDKVTELAELHCSRHSDSSVFNAAIPLENSSAYEEQMVSYSTNNPVGATMHDSSDFDGAVPLKNSSAYEEQIVLYNAYDSVGETMHGVSISHDLNTDVSSFADDPNMTNDDMVKFADIDLRDGQEHIKIDKTEASRVPQRKNASFKKMFMRSLSSKLRWSKKQANTHQAVLAGSQSQDAENHGYQVVSSSDDLEDDWEVV